jgi:hypothetical protein
VSRNAVAPIAYLPSYRDQDGRHDEGVRRMLAATVELLRESSYADLEMRSISERARVPRISGAAYFPSMSALIGEVYLRLLRDAPLIVDVNQSVPARVTAQLRDLATLLADEPEVAAACSIALMGNEPSVRAVREKIGAEVNRRIRAALGWGAWPEVADVLQLGFFGALVQAGSGFLNYREIGGALESFVGLVLGGADQ